MGKSPGRWIKTVLFGKKHSKLSKNATPGKKAAGKTPVEHLVENSEVVSDPYRLADKGVENMELENAKSGTTCESIVSADCGSESESTFVPIPVDTAETRRQVEAATKAQAAFRGYLARRAFRALKGIIRLQALIRGHLVRRQAVATLRCIHAIVKFQALARGRRVRLSDARLGIRTKYNMGELRVDIGANSVFRSEKLATNTFVRKLLVSVPIAMPLSLQYHLSEPNSAWNWLDRWSLSRFWEPPGRPRKVSNVKPQRKQSGSQIVENEAGKSKRCIRKASTNGDNGVLGSFEMDKPKRNLRKATSHQTELVQEQPQNELDRVKRNLRKVSQSVTAPSEKPEMEAEKQLQLSSAKTLLNPAAPPDVPEQEIILPKKPDELDVIVDKPSFLEAPSKPMITDEPVGASWDDHPLIEIHSSENGQKMENMPSLREELNSKEDEDGKENQKIRKRRSLPTKQENAENISQNTPSLPSYMAATESAKAKLRAQDSPKISEDGAEHGYVRRHSLPTSANGKLSSLSPRIQKPVQANGKGNSKTNRLTTASRDDKVLQPGWRR